MSECKVCRQLEQTEMVAFARMMDDDAPAYVELWRQAEERMFRHHNACTLYKSQWLAREEAYNLAESEEW